MRRWFRKPKTAPDPLAVSESRTVTLSMGHTLMLRARGSGAVVVRSIGNFTPDLEVENTLRRLERENERLQRLLREYESVWAWV